MKIFVLKRGEVRRMAFVKWSQPCISYLSFHGYRIGPFWNKKQLCWSDNYVSARVGAPQEQKLTRTPSEINFTSVSSNLVHIDYYWWATFAIMEYKKLSTSDRASTYTDKSSSENLSPPSQRLLNNEEDTNLDFDDRSRHRRRRSFIRAAIIHSVIFGTYCLGVLGVNSLFRQQPGPQHLTFSKNLNVPFSCSIWQKLIAMV